MRWRRQRAERPRDAGALSVEYAAIVVVAATLIAALIALPLSEIVGAWTRYATCRVIGLDCRRPGTARGPAMPAACDLASATSTTHARATVAVVDAASAEGYQVVRSSDGQVSITYALDTGVGASLSAGHHLVVEHGERASSAGGSARVGLSGNVVNGTTWTFDSVADAAAWLDWHRAVEVAGDRYDTPLALRWHNPMAWGRRNSIGARLDRALAHRVNALARRIGRGVDEPPEPQRTERFVGGGWDLEATALAGTLATDVAARVGVGARLGQAVDEETGATTLYWGIDAAAAIGASGWTEAAEGTIGAVSTVGLSVDADGRPTTLELVTQLPGAAGLDVAALDDPGAVLGRPWHADTGATSVYELTMSMPLDTASVADVVDRLGQIGSATVAGGRKGSLVDELWERGTVAVVEYDLARTHHGIDVSTATGIGGAVGGGRQHSDASATSAYYLDHADEGGDRAWNRWTTCVPHGGADRPRAAQRAGGHRRGAPVAGRSRWGPRSTHRGGARRHR